jgi:hypothetical protein
MRLAAAAYEKPRISVQPAVVCLRDSFRVFSRAAGRAAGERARRPSDQSRAGNADQAANHFPCSACLELRGNSSFPGKNPKPRPSDRREHAYLPPALPIERQCRSASATGSGGSRAQSEASKDSGNLGQASSVFREIKRPREQGTQTLTHRRDPTVSAASPATPGAASIERSGLRSRAGWGD